MKELFSIINTGFVYKLSIEVKPYLNIEFNGIMAILLHLKNMLNLVEINIKIGGYNYITTKGISAIKKCIENMKFL